MPVSIIEDEEESVNQALEMARAGDLVVVFVDRVDETIEQIKRASRAVAQEQSDAFWCPIPDNSPEALRARVEAVGEVAAQNTYDDDEEGSAVLQGVGATRGKHNGSRPEIGVVRMPVRNDGEPDGHS